jgi:putative PIN family toxin of toxin-antitoxin system
MLRAVIDTNILIATLGKRSPFRWLYDGILNESFILLLTNSILHEYHEIMQFKMSNDVADSVCNLLCVLPTVEFITPYFAWNLVERDADDNKFVDCAVAGGAHALVTLDNHFTPLKALDFPPIPVMNIEEFFQLLQQAKRI